MKFFFILFGLSVVACTKTIQHMGQPSMKSMTSILDFNVEGNGKDETALIQKALVDFAAQGGGTLYMPSTKQGYKVKSNAFASKPAISIPPNVLVRCDLNTRIYDIGDYVTILIDGKKGHTFNGIENGIISNGKKGTGKAKIGILVNMGRRLVIKPTQITGRYEAAIKLEAKANQKIVYSEIKTHIPAKNAPLIGLLSNTEENGFITSNYIDLICTGVQNGLILKGRTNTNRISGAFEVKSGGTCMLVGDGVRKTNSNVFLYVRIEGYDTAYKFQKLSKLNIVQSFTGVGNVVDHGKSNTFVSGYNDLGRSPVAYKNITSGVIKDIAPNESVEFFRFNLATKRHLRLYSGQCHSIRGKKNSDWVLEVIDVKDKKVIYQISDVTYKRGYPLGQYVYGQPKEIAIRLKNKSKSPASLYGSISLSIDGE